MSDLRWVEYHQTDAGEWVPFAIRRGSAVYDAEWCKRDQCLYVEVTGFDGDNDFDVGRFVDPGIQAKVWVAPGVKLTCGTGRHRVEIDDEHRASFLAARGYELIPDLLAPDPFADTIEDDARYCAICDDWLPSENLCEHVWWCEADGWYRGPGAEESKDPCEDEDCRACGHHRSTDAQS